jgi:prepilin-type N-terminal cleavage/methylation domain-containing protein
MIFLSNKLVKSQPQLKESLGELGFTLIELIVVIAIMMLLLGSGIVTYLQFNDRQAVLAAGAELTDLLRVAQTRARLGDKPAGCDKLFAYYVRAPIDSSTLRLEAECDTGSFLRSETTLTANTRATQAINIGFEVLQGGVINPGNISLLSPAGLQFQLTVNAGGEITKGELVN